jgi:AhpD family alkylhydroperoxidase
VWLKFNKRKNKAMGQTVEEFNAYRQRMNDRLMQEDQKMIKRIFNLDTNAYMEGHLPVKTKELLGLGNSLVLRCDDCVKYHLQTCFELGISKEEVMEAMSISLLIGGTIVIPHLRRAVEFWDALCGQSS